MLRILANQRLMSLIAAVGVFLLAGAALGQVPAEVPSPPGRAVTSAAPGGIWEAVLFYIIAATAVVTSLGVCISRNIVRMAVWLFGALGSVAMLYFMLAATFLGAIQLIVYAGGTLVLLIFGVMLTSKSPWARYEAGILEVVSAAVVCVGLFAALSVVIARTAWAGVETLVPGAPVAEFGRLLVTKYLVPFEVAGVLLMIVMVGAAHLAREERE